MRTKAKRQVAFPIWFWQARPYLLQGHCTGYSGGVWYDPFSWFNWVRPNVYINPDRYVGDNK